MAIAIRTSTPGAISSYQDVLDAITEETDGRASTPSLARFVRSAETYIAAILRTNPVRPMMTSTPITIGSEFLAYPTDMIRPYAVEIVVDGRTREVEFVAPEDAAELQAVRALDSTPCRFTVTESNLRFWPVPTISYTATLRYYRKLPALSEDMPTNWLLDEFPNVYLEGGLYYAYRDMPDIDKATALKALFDESIQQVLDAYPKPANRSTLRMDPALMMVPGCSTRLPV